MLNVVGVEDGELNGVANTVVGAECGAFGVHPVAVDIGLDGVFAEVKIHIHQFVAHHIHVALQYGGSPVLVAFRGGLAYDDVTRFVDNGFQSMLLTEVFQISDHLLLVLRGAGNLVDVSELLENASWFQFCHNMFNF